MLIKIFSTVIFFLLISVFNVSAVEISADKAIVLNADTKEIIFEKNADQIASMASTTKIMTSIIAVESGRLNQHVRATNDILAEGTSIGLKNEDVLTLEALVYGMMLESGNDAANLCAVALGGDYKGFAEMMNKKAAQIGMKNTNFVTPSGLDDKEHYTTAYDMALLGAYSIRNPVFREICSAKSKQISFLKPEKSITLSNHNRLLDSCEGVFGIKTGFTKKSGRCLVTACQRSDVTLICVTLNAPDDWNDHKKLYDYAFADVNISTVKGFESEYVNIYGSQKNKLRVNCSDYIYSYHNADCNIEKKIFLPGILYAPVRKNDIIGYVCFYDGERFLGTENIYADEDVYSSEETFKNKKSILTIIKDFISERIK